MRKHRLSKSTFLRAVQCPKSLYLYQYYKNLRQPPTTDRQALLNRGQEVGTLAWACFPEGVDARTGEAFRYGKAVQRTQRLIREGTTTLFEATFQEDGVLVMVDVLTCRNGYWEAIEVKSSARVARHHIKDGALQYHVLKQAGISLNDFGIMHLNKQYVRKGSLEVNALFTRESILNQVLKKQPWVRDTIAYGKAVLDKPTVPKTPIGKQCTNPYPCDFINYCWQHVPKDSVFNLGHLDADTKFTWFKEGYRAINDLDPEAIESPAIALQVRSHQQQQPYMDHKALAAFMANFTYPLTFMDFEAIMPAVPVFEGTRPFQKMAFQYALHRQAKPGGELSLKSWIATPGEPPHGPFLEQFLADTAGKGDLVVFEDTLERQILANLKQEFPAYADALQDRLDRIRDLRHPFKHMHYYHPAMKGDFSLQGIYEALFGRDQTEKAIEDGGIAAIRYEHLLTGDWEPATIEARLAELEAYCAGDTLALARIFHFLEQQIESITS